MGRTERLIEIASPVLDGILRVGERISRMAEPTDHEYYPVRSLASPDDDPVPGSTSPPDFDAGGPSGSSLG